MQNIDDFITSLLDDKGITDVSADTRQELEADLKHRLIDQINKAAIMELSEDKASELAELIEKPDFTPEKMTDFMQNSGVNLTEIALDTMLKFRNFYLGTEV